MPDLRKRVFSKGTIDAAVAMYLAGSGVKEVGRMLGISKDRIAGWVREAGGKVRSGRTDDSVRDEIKRLYEQGCTSQQIVMATGFTRNTVEAWLKKLGVTKRKPYYWLKTDPLKDRLERNVIPEPNSGCWLWTGTLDTAGYGCVRIHSAPPIKSKRASRVAWEVYNGPIPDGLIVCHRCDNPPCCNPEHLFLGTHADNAADKARKGRQPTKLTANQVCNLRELFELGVNRREIARRFGINLRHVYYIAQRDNWKHVP